MSWMQKLCDVYDTMAGVEGCSILPIGFAQKRIKYHVILTSAGEFDTAYVLSDQEQLCSVPSTPQAEGRTGSNGAPFPLADNLKCLIGGQADAYLRQLDEWCQAEDAPACLRVLYTYLEKKTLLQDLMSVPSLNVRYHKDEEKQDGAGPDAKSMVCFSVQSASPLDTAEQRLWMRRDVRKSWTRRFAALSNEEPALCYATGEKLPILQNHPKLSGNAKLISAKDVGFPFQYKGRFVADRSAAEVSVIASTKMHSALRWLLEHQGFTRYGMSLVAWNTSQPALEKTNFFGDDQPQRQPDTFEPYALALRDAAAGYLSRLRRFPDKATEEAKNRMQEIVILGLQAATDGRMSITYYQELPGNLYVNRLHAWAEACQWEFPGKEKQVRTPTWWDICEAVMGADALRIVRSDAKGGKALTKQMREMQLRLLSCEVNGSHLPKDFLQQAFHRTLQPLRFTDKKGSWSPFAWAQSIAVTCALLRKVRSEEKAPVPSWVLDRENRNRDYLYGRLLAVAHKLELDAGDGKDPRTMAVRLLAQYTHRPDETWLHLYPKLLPYLRRIGRAQPAGRDGNRAREYQRLFGEIERLFRPEERLEMRPLSYEFLVGFSAQLRELFLEKECRQTPPTIPPFALPKQRDALYGCLLAVADHCEWIAESYAKIAPNEQRYRVSRRDGRTNAILLTAAYLTAPARTWAQVHDRLIPYLEKLGVKHAKYFQCLLRRIEQSFDEEDRRSMAPLGSLFLHGYLGMRYALLMTKDGLDRETWNAEKPGTPVLLNTREAAYGALLALENQVERWVLDREKREEENRFSNAMRFLSRAAQKPDEVMEYLTQRMKPYEEKMAFPPAIKEKRENIQHQIERENWNTSEPLAPSYLHTFYCYDVTQPNGKEG